MTLGERLLLFVVLGAGFYLLYVIADRVDLIAKTLRALL